MVDSISRIASALESAKVITREAAAVASSKLGESSYTHYSEGIAPEQLRELLNSRNSREVKDGLRRIIAIMASGDGSIDVETYFSDVVKNITFGDAKIKTLVCIYLQRFAEGDSNLALLSINSLQKTLTDGDPEIRALSIKALADIKVPSLHPIVVHSLKKAVSDSSASVRSEVSFAILKLFIARSDEFADELLQLLEQLLSDADPLVLSSAVVVLHECFPERLDLLHSHFRYFCSVLHRMDPFSQAVLITLLIRYCKTFLPRPKVVDTSSEAGESIPLPNKYNEISFPVYDAEIHPDLGLFLKSLERLVFSSNATVLLASSNAFLQLATPMQFKKSRLPQALVRAVSSSSNLGVQITLLQSCCLLSMIDPTLFLPYVKKFFVLPSDDAMVGSLKVRILSILTNESNVKVIVKELKYIISNSKSPALVIAATNSLAVCAMLSPGWEAFIIKGLISNMEIEKLPAAVLGSYVDVIRILVQRNPKRHISSIMKLVKVLDARKALSDNARASIVSIVGEIAAFEYKICPDILRKLVGTFAYEGPETRCQILLLSAKLLSYEIERFKAEQPEETYNFSQSRVAQICQYVVHLAGFDEEFDIRDRARAISSLYDTGKYEIAALLFQAPKPSPKMTLISDDVELGDHSIQHFGGSGLDKCVTAYYKMIPWNDEEPNAADDLRNPATLKDYSRYTSSLSGSFISASKSSGTNLTQDSSASISHTSLASHQGKKYRLQTLDEFFSDIPSTRTTKKKIVIQEESSSDESGETDSADDSEEDSTDQSSSSSSSVPVHNND
ncbi:hypothetical protein HG536_0A00670 [Torulaspora globosa]|uniref:Clathrin/coatomer adaptor adaptin-like N-terminal domain-containing protein n=1 Tax=Torulaspora globosa TaxID=48254 RepID=A0A7G3Z9R4_9SACH|nr:uncharacterized protein HG536_0A00670 [Torulaspora globosa]QLL30250.1 hypothetical protein HG536_0A00670 [Torulaspora globosa]